MGLPYDSGLGLVYPLLFGYPDDENVADYSDAWMFGEWLLVAPITERGQSVKWIYLPEGTWIDYNRGTVYEGGQYIPYETAKPRDYVVGAMVDEAINCLPPAFLSSACA